MWVIALLDVLTLSSTGNNNSPPVKDEEEQEKGSPRRQDNVPLKEYLEAARAIEQTMYEHPAEQYNETMQLCLAVIRLSTREQDPNGKPFRSFKPGLWWPDSIVHYLRYTSTQALRRMLACENEWEHSILDQWNWERDILNQEISLEEEETTDQADDEKVVSEHETKKKQYSSSFVSADKEPREKGFSSTQFNFSDSKKKNVGERHCVCGSRRIVTSTHQMRKADEGATTVFRCVECNRTWRKNA
jgi:DNA-directed RNA polymerase subunit M/transcription elongation factor TFIIS